MSATTPSYTGNVSEWTWQHAGRDENTYAFAYDSFARLTDTRHYEAGALTDRFAEKGLTYDANGNMTHDGANDLDITYNCLNMTQKVEKKGTLSANYSYLADSTKLSATDSIIRVLWYMGNVTENYRSKARGSTEAGSS